MARPKRKKTNKEIIQEKLPSIIEKVEYALELTKFEDNKQKDNQDPKEILIDKSLFKFDENKKELIFDSYDNFCKFLDIPILNSSSKSAQLKVLSKYLDIDTIKSTQKFVSDKYIIQKVFPFLNFNDNSKKEKEILQYTILMFLDNIISNYDNYADFSKILLEKQTVNLDGGNYKDVYYILKNVSLQNLAYYTGLCSLRLSKYSKKPRSFIKEQSISDPKNKSYQITYEDFLYFLDKYKTTSNTLLIDVLKKLKKYSFMNFKERYYGYKWDEEHYAKQKKNYLKKMEQQVSDHIKSRILVDVKDYKDEDGNYFVDLKEKDFNYKFDLVGLTHEEEIKYENIQNSAQYLVIWNNCKNPHLLKLIKKYLNLDEIPSPRSPKEKTINFTDLMAKEDISPLFFIRAAGLQFEYEHLLRNMLFKDLGYKQIFQSYDISVNLNSLQTITENISQFEHLQDLQFPEILDKMFIPDNLYLNYKLNSFICLQLNNSSLFKQKMLNNTIKRNEKQKQKEIEQLQQETRDLLTNELGSLSKKELKEISKPYQEQIDLFADLLDLFSFEDNFQLSENDFKKKVDKFFEQK